MTISEDVGSVATLWRFPVKSMGGEQLRDVCGWHAGCEPQERHRTRYCAPRHIPHIPLGAAASPLQGGRGQMYPCVNSITHVLRKSS
jgi:hypothetical protein